MATRRVLSTVLAAAVSLALVGVGVTSAGVAVADSDAACSAGTPWLRLARTCTRRPAMAGTPACIPT